VSLFFCREVAWFAAYNLKIFKGIVSPDPVAETGIHVQVLLRKYNAGLLNFFIVSEILIGL
jgi:hypothetical protein